MKRILNIFLFTFLFISVPKVFAYDFTSPLDINLWSDWSFTYNETIGIDTDKNQNIYVAECETNDIKKYDGSSWTTIINSNLNCPHDIAVNPTNNYIYVTDDEYGGQEIKIFNQSGVYQSAINGSSIFSSIAFDADGNLYRSASDDTKYIQKYNSDHWDNVGSANFSNITDLM